MFSLCLISAVGEEGALTQQGPLPAGLTSFQYNLSYHKRLDGARGKFVKLGPSKLNFMKLLKFKNPYRYRTFLLLQPSTNAFLSNFRRQNQKNVRIDPLTTEGNIMFYLYLNSSLFIFASFNFFILVTIYLQVYVKTFPKYFTEKFFNIQFVCLSKITGS